MHILCHVHCNVKCSRHHVLHHHAADSCVMPDRLLALEHGIQRVCLGQSLALVRWVSTTEQR